MSFQENEQWVLEATENQLRIEEPDLVESFLAFASITPAIKPVKGWDRTSPARGRRGHSGGQGHAFVTQLLLAFITTISVAALLFGATWWILPHS